MKKTILMFALMVSFGVLVTSCKETKKEEVKTETHQHDASENDLEGKDMAQTFQCPMDCEKGKTYDKEGSCPVCKMDLKEKKSKGGDE